MHVTLRVSLTSPSRRPLAPELVQPQVVDLGLALGLHGGLTWVLARQQLGGTHTPDWPMGVYHLCTPRAYGGRIRGPRIPPSL